MGMCSSKSSSPPPPDPRIYEVAAQQVNLSQQTLDFFKRAYEENKPRQAALDDLQMRVGESYLQDATTNRERGNEAYDFYMKNARPVEEQMFRDAQTIDSESNIQRVRGQAMADVNTQFGNVRGQVQRSMARYGLTVDPSRLYAINSQLAAQQAAAGAAAMTGAEQGQRDRGVALRGQAANFGRGYPAQALQFGQAATAGGQAAVGNQIAANASNQQMQQGMGQGFQVAGNQLSQAGGLYSNTYGQQLQGWGMAQQQRANSSSGFGSLLGTVAGGIGGFMLGGPAGAFAGASIGGGVGGQIFHEGGQVKGANAAIPMEDVPATLQEGEFVIPREVVQAKGTEFFEKLIEKHKPGARRAAIKG